MRKPFIILLLLFCSVLNAQDRFRIQDFSGGLDYSSPRSGLQQGKYLQFINFIINGPWLEAREGLTGWNRSTDFSSNSVKFMSVWQTDADWQLLVSDGEDIWIGNDSADYEVQYNPFNYSEFKCSTTAGDSIVYGTNGGQKWLSVFGYGYGQPFYITNTAGDKTDTFTVSHIPLDTVLILTDTVGLTTTGDTIYEIGVDFGNIGSTINWGEKLYVSSDHGLFYWNGNDFQGIDSANEPYRYLVDSIKTYKGNWQLIIDDADSGCGSCNDWTYGQYNGWYAMYTTNPFFQDSGIQANKYFKTVYRINATSPCSLRLDMEYTKAMVLPADEFITLTQREPDYSERQLVSKTSDTECCILSIYPATDSGLQPYFAWDTANAIYKALVALSIDTSYFEAGDWMAYPFSYGDEFKEKFFIVGGIAPVIIKKWACYPLNPMGFPVSPSTSIGDTNYWFVNDTFALVRLKKSTGSSLDGSYKFMERYKNRLFYVKNDPNILYYSQKYYPDSLSDSWSFLVETHDGDWITGLKVQGNFLNVYKNNSILKVYPQQFDFTNYANESGFDYILSNYGIGCIASQTIVDVNGIHYFLSNEGFVAYDGNNYQVLSQAIDGWLEDSLDYDNISLACAEHYNGNIWLSIPTLPNTVTKNTLTFLYNISTNSWTRFDFGIGDMIFNTRPDDTLDFFIGSPDSGFIFTYGGDDDGSDSIVAIVQTDYLDFGLPHQYKISRELVIPYDMPTACNLGISLYRDYSTTALWIDTLTHTATYGQFRIPCKDTAYGRNLSLRMTFYNAADVKIPWIEWFVKAKGLAR